jgi:PAS domain S-box-containing protein
VGLTLLYVLAARIGLSFAFLHASATPVWPPTGIALAALLLLGPGMWPAVFAGALIANLLTAGSIATSLGIALGNTLEAVIGATLVIRLAGGRAVFDRAPDIFKFVGLAALSTAASATIGVTSLGLAGEARWADYGAIWVTWWLGDAAGALVVTPLLLLWSRPASRTPGRLQALEAAGVVTAAAAIGAVVFGGILPGGMAYAPMAFVCIPPLLWAAFRFGQREAATLIALLSGIAVAATARGTGPFALATPNASLLLLQAFMATMAVTMLPLGAVVSEWRRTTQQLRTALADQAALLHQREQATAAARESEARLHRMIHAAMDAILSVDERQRIVIFNGAAERMFRCTAAEAVGQPLDRFIPPRVREAHRRHVEEFGRHGATARRMGALGELAGLRADGEAFPIEASISQAEAGGQKLYTVILRDITERKRAEAALRASEEKSATVFRTSPSGIVLSTLAEGLYLDANEAFLRMLGYTREELIGRTAVELGIWKDPEDRARAIAEMARTGAIREWEATFRRKSGEEFTALSSCERLHMDGRPVVLANVLDITERKRKQDDLRQAVADKDTLLREVHHRVKNNFQMLCDLLYLQAMSLEGREAQPILLDTYGRMFAMARLHEQLYQSLASGEIRLGEYVSGLVGGFASVHPEVPIRLDVSGEAVTLDVDRAIHTGLILNELLTNAVKHAFRDGRAGEAVVRLCRREEQVELQVHDTGPGLPADFDLAQARSLGLRIVHILAQRLNATVRLENSGGACFTIRFPVKAPE